MIGPAEYAFAAVEIAVRGLGLFAEAELTARNNVSDLGNTAFGTFAGAEGRVIPAEVVVSRDPPGDRLNGRLLL